MKNSKKFGIIGIVIAVILILIIVWSVVSSSKSKDAENPLNQYLREQDDIMEDMMDEMEVEPEGNAAEDFLEGMLPHHEAAIEMAEAYLRYGGETQALKQLANDIISAQTGEIKQMQRLDDEIEKSGVIDTEKEQGYLNAYQKMMSEHHQMNHGTSAVSTIDAAFAEGMIMHHQMAVDMAKAVLDYTDHAEVRSLAETIIETQEREINQMQEFVR